MNRLTRKNKNGNWEIPVVATYKKWDKEKLISEEQDQSVTLESGICDAIAAYEDILFDADGNERISLDRLRELCEADREGRAVVLPPLDDFERQEMADAFHDWCSEWVDDPSVGLRGMTDYECAFMAAITSYLTRAEAEAALKEEPNNDKG